MYHESKKMVSQFYRRFKEILNWLYAIEEQMESCDLIKYVVKAFPWTTLWLSMVEAYKIPRDLSIVKLDKLFYKVILYE